METVKGMKSEIERLAAILSGTPDLLPTFGGSAGAGRPHGESESVRLFYVLSERGSEFSCRRQMTLARDELLKEFQSRRMRMSTEMAGHEGRRRGDVAPTGD
jgi:hypothetical protein